jgi:hypothetical protein
MNGAPFFVAAIRDRRGGIGGARRRGWTWVRVARRRRRDGVGSFD